MMLCAVLLAVSTVVAQGPMLAAPGALQQGVGKLPLKGAKTLTVVVVPPPAPAGDEVNQAVMVYAQEDMARSVQSVTAVMADSATPTREELVGLFKDAGTDALLVLRMMPAASGGAYLDLHAEVLDHAGFPKARFKLARAVFLAPSRATPTPAPVTAAPAPTPVQPAPVQPAPVQPAPVQPAPVQPVPVQPVPVQPVPVQPVPVQPAPVVAPPAPPAAGATMQVYQCDEALLGNAVARLVDEAEWTKPTRTLVYASLPEDADGGGAAYHHLWVQARAATARALERSMPDATVEEFEDSATVHAGATLGPRTAARRARRHVVVKILAGPTPTVTLLARTDNVERGSVTVDAQALQVVTVPANAGKNGMPAVTRAWRRAAFLEDAVKFKDGEVMGANGGKRDLKQFANKVDDHNLDAALSAVTRNTVVASVVATAGLIGFLFSMAVGCGAGLVLCISGGNALDNDADAVGWGLWAGSVASCLCIPACQALSWGGVQSLVGVLLPVKVEDATLRGATQKYNRRILKEVALEPDDVDESLVGHGDDD